MCPDKSILSAYFDGEVDLQWSAKIKIHLTECKICSSYINELTKQKQILQSAEIPDFNDSLDRVKSIIRERQTVSGTLRFWEKKIPLPVAAAAAVIAALVTLGVNIFTINQNEPQIADFGDKNYSGYSVDLPGEKLNEIFSMIDSDQFDEFSSNTVVELPVDVNLVFYGDSQLVRTAGYVGDGSH